MLYIGIDIGTATAGIAARGDDGEERVRVMPADFRAGGELSLQTAVKSADDISEKLLCETIHDFDARTAADMADRSATVVLTCRGGLEKDPETAGEAVWIPSETPERASETDGQSMFYVCCPARRRQP